MLLLDANILIYAFREELLQHASARAWLLSALSGGEPIGVPTLAEIAFLRLCTGPIIITVPSFTRACETALPVFRKGSLFD